MNAFVGGPDLIWSVVGAAWYENAWYVVSMMDKLADRVLALLGLDMDFSLSLSKAPFNAITDDLYLGMRPDPSRVGALQEAGVTHVVSCLPASARAQLVFLQEAFETTFIPVHDGIHEDIASTFPGVFDFVQTATRRGDAKVFVHCEVGVSRSATLVTALLMHRRRQRFFEAYCDVRAKRPEVLPNIGFASQLQRFESELFRRRTTTGRSLPWPATSKTSVWFPSISRRFRARSIGTTTMR